MAVTTIPMVRNDPWRRYGKESKTTVKASGIKLPAKFDQEGSNHDGCAGDYSTFPAEME
jgi:hypothetical protein